MSNLTPTFKGCVPKQTQGSGLQLKYKWLKVHRLQLQFSKSTKVLGGEEEKGKCYSDKSLLLN